MPIRNQTEAVTQSLTYREIYLWAQAQMKIRGITKNQAVLEAGGKFNKDERTIWRALRKLTNLICNTAIHIPENFPFFVTNSWLLILTI